MCSKLTLTIRNDVNWYRCGAFIIDFEHNNCKVQGIKRVVHLVPSQMSIMELVKVASQPAFTCSKLTIKTLGQAVKYVQS